MEAPDFQTKASFDQQRRGFRGTAENAKTKICMRWKAGHCRFGDQCNFAHGEHELRSLPPREFNPPRGRGFGGFEQHHRGGRGGGGHFQEYQDDMRGEYHGGYWDKRGNGYDRPPSDYPTFNGWTEYRTDEGEAYYHHEETQTTQWDPPNGWPSRAGGLM